MHSFLKERFAQNEYYIIIYSQKEDYFMVHLVYDMRVNKS